MLLVTPSILIILFSGSDEKIKFDNHIMHVERKANTSIHIIREIKGLANSSILRSTGSMLPSTSIASLPDVAGNPKHIDNPFLWIASNYTPRKAGQTMFPLCS
jgi:hypothetical protein